MPSQFATHPQTGSYCMLQTQSLNFSLAQSSVGNFVPLQLNKNAAIISKRIFNYLIVNV